VCGAGNSNTPSSFVGACDRFFTLKGEGKTKNTTPKGKIQKKSLGQSVNEKEKSSVPTKEEVIKYVKTVISENPNGSMLLSKLMKILYRKYPNFNVTDYGYKKSVELFSSVPSSFQITKNDDLSILISLIS
jgi:hypothetical protein